MTSLQWGKTAWPPVRWPWVRRAVLEAEQANGQRHYLRYDGVVAILEQEKRKTASLRQELQDQAGREAALRTALRDTEALVVADLRTIERLQTRLGMRRPPGGPRHIALVLDELHAEMLGQADDEGRPS